MYGYQDIRSDDSVLNSDDYYYFLVIVCDNKSVIIIMMAQRIKTAIPRETLSAFARILIFMSDDEFHAVFTDKDKQKCV